MSSLLGHISTRARLISLLLSALLPMSALLVAGIVLDYRDTTEQAYHELEQLAQVASLQQADVFSATKALLSAVRLMPDVTAEGGEACQRIIRSVRDAHPQFLTMGVVDARGTITCHSDLSAHSTFGNQKLIRQMLAPQAPRFMVGDFMVGRVTKQPTFAIAMSLPKVDGYIRGVVFVSMNLARMGRAAEALTGGRWETVALVQPRSDRMLVQYPAGDKPVGTTYIDHPLMALMRDKPAGGVAEAPGLDGVVRLHGFYPVSGAETAGLMLVVGLDPGIVFSAVQHRTLLYCAAMLVVLLGAIAAAWALGYWTQLRPVHRLTKTAGQIATGEFAARAGIEPWQAPEFRELGATLDRMAVQLEQGDAAERVVVASEARYRLLADNTLDLISQLDANGRRVFVSPASRDVLGFEPEELLAKSPRELVHPDDQGVLDDMMRQIAAGSSVFGIQLRERHREGHYIWIEVNGRALPDSGGVVFSVRDISARKEMERELEAANHKLSMLAATDGLTGLANRRSFDDTLQRELARSLRERTDLSLVLIDVDHFKRYNDTYGHPAGDDALRIVAAEIRRRLRRPGDFGARYGGEEFAVILPNTSPEGATQWAETLRASLESLDIRHTGSPLGHMTISLGVGGLSLGPGSIDRAALVALADHALYFAKNAGRNRVETAEAHSLRRSFKKAFPRAETAGTADHRS